MRFIPTSAAKVEALKKQAKQLQRGGGGKHAALLNRVARTAGYEHWHHVTLCLREATETTRGRGLVAEIEAILDATMAGASKVVLTGVEASISQQFLLMSSGDGDAWLLDPEKNLALCLAWHGERQPLTIRELATAVELGWDGTFDLNGPFFVVSTEHANVGSRHIAGYPIEELRQLLEDVRSPEKRLEAIFASKDAIALTEEIIEQLMRTGWEKSALLAAARQGGRYSPSRNTVLFPPVEGP